MMSTCNFHKTLRAKIAGLLIILLGCCTTAMGDGHTIPFFRNFPASEYHAHNRNFDIVCDDYGSVFVANFEGLLYYNGSSWRKIHTPGISRVTSLAKDSKGKIWFGGYNVFGYLKPDKQGRLGMETVVSDKEKNGLGEVDMIKESGKTIYVHTTNGKIYSLGKGNKLQRTANSSNIFSKNDSTASLRLRNGCDISFSHAKGLSFNNTRTKERTSNWETLSEAEGLISNTVNKIAFNNGNIVWGATDKGIFCIEAVSPYSMLNEHTGLKGEVYCITQCENVLYLGTMEGLFCIDKNVLTRISNIDLACWQFANTNNGIVYAATSMGLYKIGRKSVSKMSEGNTLSVCLSKSGEGCYTGEFDGIYYNSTDGKRKKISDIEKATRLSITGRDVIAETINGELWSISTVTEKAKCLRKKSDVNEPKVKYVDVFGTTWETDNTGHNLSAKSVNNYAKVLEPWTNPFRPKTLNTLFVSKVGDVWVGGDFGAYRLAGKELTSIDKGKAQAPYIREIVIMGDSTIWGGYDADMKPRNSLTGLELPSSCNHIMVSFAPKGMSIIKPTLYRHRINGGRWSAWSEASYVEFNNQFYGSTKVEIQTLDLFGRISSPGVVEWYKEFPIYARWWARIIYLIIIIYCVTLFFRWRTKRLKKEKEKLEGIVAERTSELSAAYNEQQKISGQLKEAYDEQQKISSELADTLDDLKRTQNDLVRMERTATAGKLTQGLIDRILNPINYINNFSKLTSGLAKDLHEDIEDEKDNMSEDNYEDCEDIIDMMKQNLQKIEEHGVNTTRTLRAMEAMLNNHVGTLVSQDILPLCRQAVAVAIEYFKNDISRCGISIRADVPDTPVMVNYDGETINKVLLSLITNSVYAVAKKFTQCAYANPEVVLKATVNGDNICISIRDNGIGIEDTIKDKVFDPFFTTKPTGEAAGVGLYLVREIINDHKGTISVSSVKGEYCEFTITLPCSIS